MLDLAAVKTETTGRVALRVEVDHEHDLACEGQVGREIDDGGGLADAALLVGAGDDLAHSGPRYGGRHAEILAFGAVPRIFGRRREGRSVDYAGVFGGPRELPGG